MKLTKYENKLGKLRVGANQCYLLAELGLLDFPAAEVVLTDRWLGVLFDKKVDEMRRTLRQKLFE